MNLFELTKNLMNIPSVSGDEQAVGFYLRDYLESLGWTVELQAVSENQNNVIAYLNDTPRVFLSTHIDTVPPFIPPTEDAEKIYGRGACDAKGIIASQIMAAEELRKAGIEDIGLLYTVEEERSSTGAKAANLLNTTERIINYKIKKYGINPKRFRGWIRHGAFADGAFFQQNNKNANQELKAKLKIKPFFASLAKPLAIFAFQQIFRNVKIAKKLFENSKKIVFVIEDD